ncbi:uncharacterized protein VP01_922g3 [Puccinia sorghi]|uniref:Uncharacterized protein n=1 Tax=Puccinia sorghi TaxID=27349 RepID=A0A0L6U9D2_9BASI|nr:uncharacterized protein VP01_922g3 [Puccinia sorghi]
MYVGAALINPPNHGERGSRYLPRPRPNRPPPPATKPKPSHLALPPQSNDRIRKILIPDVNEATILLDSGSAINLSGRSPFFTITSRLNDPVDISLAISDPGATIEYIGRLSIPTPSGKMVIDDVYFCKKITGSIISTGRLISSGWKLDHEGVVAKLSDPKGNSFGLDYKNYCWTIKMLIFSAKINKITQIPCLDPFTWHV